MKNFILLTALLFSFFTMQSQEETNPLWLRHGAISPDGSQVAFCYKGDIYLVATAGGEARPLTINDAYDTNPIWSHDGQQIAFESNRYGNFDVFVVSKSGGEPQRITYHSANDHPSDFSPDNQNVIFTSTRLDNADNGMFPYGGLSELYSVPATGGRVTQLLTIPAEKAKYSPDGNFIYYQDNKGYEDGHRKHHTSPITRDLWSYNITDKTYKKLTQFSGEDRNPVFSKNGNIYYLNEKYGSFNIYRMELENPKNGVQITYLGDHPVRHLSASDNGKLCFSYNGELYTVTESNKPDKIKIIIRTDTRYQPTIEKVTGNVRDIAVSPNGKEVAFIHRGEVFVTSVESKVTKQITKTPEQERSVDFSPDGRSLVYAGERNGGWNIYQTSLTRESEKYFFNSTILEEKDLVATEVEEFFPRYSPDGKEVAFLANRTEIRVINLATKAIRTVMESKWNYSYSDGDQYFTWAPDSKWIIADILQSDQWIGNLGLIDVKGGIDPINLTESGFNDYGAEWGMGGKMIYWESDRDGLKSRASWGGQSDVYAMFFDQETFDKFKMTEEEFDLIEDDKDDSEEKNDDKKEKKKGGKEKEEEKVEPLTFDLENKDDRKVRLTIHSSSLGASILSQKGDKLYYMSHFEKGYDLWETDLRTRETKILLPKTGNGNLQLSKDGKYLFVNAKGGITRIELSSKEQKSINISGEMLLDLAAERAYMFDHIWKQVKEKFYVEDLHQVNWDFYKTEYQKFLPHINNNFDFAEMESELLGELNASHTGCRYFNRGNGGDQTASLGLFYDLDFERDGLLIKEVMKKSPVIKKDSKIKAGVIIEKIDGETILANENYYPLLNRKRGKYTLLSLYDPTTKKRWEETVKPISRGAEFNLRYHRWVDQRKAIVEEKSGGKIGYVHVRGMNNGSFKNVYSEALGKNYSKEALIVDTRFNGGGWLHDDLATFLSGKIYMNILPRGQKLGAEPMFKWNKPSAVVMSEGNYSDAHLFPAVYKMLDIGPLVGMPVAGTGTAVWWERLIDQSIVFGIPQVGMVDQEGNFMENLTLDPDYKINNDPGVISKGTDQQLEKAVEVLMKK